ncbi:MAG: TetR/AcrR family transcriptional regulator [Ktedonobacterales bacterium]|jgi:AcrR family transcriptional regulator
MARKASQERRAAIIDAAAQALARDGITETTTRKIAAAAGVNQAMIGYYFGGKDELLYAVLQEMMRRTAEIANASLPNGVGFAEALTLAMEAFWRHVEEAPELQVMQYELTLYALRRPQSAWLARSQYEGYCAIVARLIAEAPVAHGESLAETPEALARFLVGGLDGMILQFISDQNGQRAHDDLRRLIAATLALARGASVAPGAASGAR